MDEFAPQTAVITGGASGIGLAIAQELAKRGVRVMLADLPSDKFDKAGQHIMGLFEVKAGQIYKKVGDVDLDLNAELKRLGLGQVKV